MNTTAIQALIRNDIRLYFTDRRAVIVGVLVPILIAAFFGYIFGGTGQSGSGRHHGVEGFREFSNMRAVFVRGEGDLLEAFAPPYGPATD